ncbi:hypothetical protein LB543_14830 [Mesorhizobium sp. ESP7-2]|uniref:hypothetical protein n=1 Tax=unclassified Mesorhizobium TaxID=325217 RepID=UPI001CCFFE06|nr:MULTISPECIES: hypothetical protein [unclassified Mesorhizobium]MBZ9671668.1 hypothetical protein [Mesorhizobium sp. ES1-3]MBZ9707997.1 hypothetical protein [Mesorhizobium sp. ESP7-2]
MKKSKPQQGRSIVRRFANWLSFKLCDKRSIDGLLVVYTGDEESKKINKVAAALKLISDFDPIRYKRMHHDLNRIWVLTIAGWVGRYQQATSTCELDERFVLNQGTTPERIASTIVHEATHARLGRCGIGYQEELRTRVEQVCIRREMAFARKLPSGADIDQRAEMKLNSLSGLSDAAMAERYFEGQRKALLYLGGPAWLNDRVVSFHRWRHLRRLKQHEAASPPDPRN